MRKRQKIEAYYQIIHTTLISETFNGDCFTRTHAIGLPQKCEIIASLVGVDLGLKGYPGLQILGSLKAVVATTSGEM